MIKISRLFLIITSLVLSVSAQRNLLPISFVPDRSAVVLRVNWTEVRTNEKLRQIVIGGSFPQMSSQLGVDEKNVREWVIFSDVNPSGANGLGIILAGNFTMQSIIKFAESKDYKAEKIGTRTVFVNPSDNSYLLPIRNGLLAAGTKTGVEKVVQTIGKPRNSLVGKQPFATVWKQLETSRKPIRFYAGIPQEYQKIAEITFQIATKLLDLTSFGFVGKIFETIGLVRSFGFTVSYNKGVFPTELVALMDSETKAWIASESVNLLKKTPAAIGLKAQTEQDAQMLKSLESMSASYKGDMLSVRFEMPESALNR